MTIKTIEDLLEQFGGKLVKARRVGKEEWFFVVLERHTSPFAMGGQGIRVYHHDKAENLPEFGRAITRGDIGPGIEVKIPTPEEKLALSWSPFVRSQYRESL